MEKQKFITIFEHIVKNSYRHSLDDDSATYFGNHEDKDVIARFEDLGMKRMLFIDSEVYYSMCINGEYGEVRKYEL